jgi:hypothetical protein
MAIRGSGAGAGKRAWLVLVAGLWLGGCAGATQAVPVVQPGPGARPEWTPPDTGARPLGSAQPVFEDGQAQVVAAFADTAQWIRHDLWVETEFDTDGDGRPGPDARERGATGPDGDGGAAGPRDLRDEPVLRGHGAGGPELLLGCSS